jgi:hypothetical protein
MESNGMKWNVMVYNYMSLFGSSQNGWSGMEHDGIHSIPLISSNFHSSQIGGYAM